MPVVLFQQILVHTKGMFNPYVNLYIVLQKCLFYEEMYLQILPTENFTNLTVATALHANFFTVEPAALSPKCSYLSLLFPDDNTFIIYLFIYLFGGRHFIM